MTKKEFVETLRMALNGKVSPGQVAENMRYYEDYINMEIRKGRNEEEVLAELGDPRLIARTIAETKGGRNGGAGAAGGEDGRNRFKLPQVLFRIPGWVWLMLFVLVVVLILGIVFSMIAALLPVLLPVLGILLLVKLFRSRRN